MEEAAQKAREVNDKLFFDEMIEMSGGAGEKE